MVELMTARNLSYFLKTKVLVFLMKRKHHVDKVFTELCYPGDPFFSIAKANHGFGGLQQDGSQFFIFGYEMIEQAMVYSDFPLRKTAISGG